MERKTLKFEIKEDSKLLKECHLTWIQDFLAKGGRQGKFKSLEEYFNSLIEKMEDWRKGKTSLRSLGLKFCEIAYLVYNGKEAEARRVINGLGNDLGELSDCKKTTTKDSYLQAINYCAVASTYQIQVLEVDKLIKLAGKGGDDLSEKLIILRKKLNCCWESLSKNDEFMATITFFKGCLAMSMGCREEIILELFKKAIECDKYGYFWNFEAYRSARRLREWRRTGDIPSDEERHFCKRAYQLCWDSDDPVVLVAYANLLHNELWRGDAAMWNANKMKLKDCVEAYKKTFAAIEKYPKNEVAHLQEQAGLSFTELLLFGKEPRLLQKLGMELLLQFCKENPQSSEALCQLGRVFHFGAYGTELFKENREGDRAIVNYLDSLAINPNNYSCFWDLLLKLKTDGKCSQDKMVFDRNEKLLEDYLEDGVKSVALLIQRGLLIWMFNPRNAANFRREACLAWVDALSWKANNFRDVYNVIRNVPWWAINNLNQSRWPQVKNVLRELEKLKRTCEKNELSFVYQFINELRKKPSVSPDAKVKMGESSGGGGNAKEAGMPKTAKPGFRGEDKKISSPAASSSKTGQGKSQQPLGKTGKVCAESDQKSGHSNSNKKKKPRDRRNKPKI